MTGRAREKRLTQKFTLGLGRRLIGAWRRVYIYIYIYIYKGRGESLTHRYIHYAFTIRRPLRARARARFMENKSFRRKRATGEITVKGEGYRKIRIL